MADRRTAMQLAAGAAALLLAGVAYGQWGVEQGPAPGIEAETEVATASNTGGYRFAVFRDADDVVRAVFELRPGLDHLDDAVCPTIFVDDQPPHLAGSGGVDCHVEIRTASFPLGRVDDGAIRSNTLLALMNGSRLFLRFRLEGVGYGQAEFSLRGSKQALNRAIGDDIDVVGE